MPLSSTKAVLELQNPLVAPPEPQAGRIVRIMHVITDLNTGGAEMMLHKVLSQMDRRRFSAEVVSLMDKGTLGERIEKLGVRVHALGMNRNFPNPLAVLRLSRLLRRSRTDLVQTWMYHANLVGGLAAGIAGGIPVVWGIHHSNFDVRKTRRRTLMTMRAGALLSSRLPSRIICCGEVPRMVHISMGYDAKRMTVVPNGFDLSTFQPNPLARLSVRKELGIPGEAPLIGLIARFHPKKDHRTFIQAAAMLHITRPDVHFLLCGEGISADNAELMGWIREAAIYDNCRLLGIRNDIPRLTAALDLATSSSSYGEGFPISLGEAMSCGVPCVATNVGDSANIVGPTGVVVSPGDPFELSQAWLFMLQLDRVTRQNLERTARQRIAANFSLPSVVARYEEVYRQCVGSVVS